MLAAMREASSPAYQVSGFLRYCRGAAIAVGAKAPGADTMKSDTSSAASTGRGIVKFDVIRDLVSLFLDRPFPGHKVLRLRAGTDDPEKGAGLQPAPLILYRWSNPAVVLP